MRAQSSRMNFGKKRGRSPREKKDEGKKRSNMAACHILWAPQEKKKRCLGGRNLGGDFSCLKSEYLITRNITQKLEKSEKRPFKDANERASTTVPFIKTPASRGKSALLTGGDFWMNKKKGGRAGKSRGGRQTVRAEKQAERKKKGKKENGARRVLGKKEALPKKNTLGGRKKRDKRWGESERGPDYPRDPSAIRNSKRVWDYGVRHKVSPERCRGPESKQKKGSQKPAKHLRAGDGG